MYACICHPRASLLARTAMDASLCLRALTDDDVATVANATVSLNEARLAVEGRLPVSPNATHEYHLANALQVGKFVKVAEGFRPFQCCHSLNGFDARYAPIAGCPLQPGQGTIDNPLPHRIFWSGTFVGEDFMDIVCVEDGSDACPKLPFHGAVTSSGPCVWLQHSVGSQICPQDTHVLAMDPARALLFLASVQRCLDDAAIKEKHRQATVRRMEEIGLGDEALSADSQRALTVYREMLRSCGESDFTLSGRMQIPPQCSVLRPHVQVALVFTPGFLASRTDSEQACVAQLWQHFNDVQHAAGYTGAYRDLQSVRTHLQTMVDAAAASATDDDEDDDDGGTLLARSTSCALPRLASTVD